MKQKLLAIGLILSLGLGIFATIRTFNKSEGILGIGTPPSGYNTTLSAPETSTDTTINVSSVTLDDDTTLTTATIYPGIFLTIEPNSATKREIVFCTGISSLTFTGCTRGLADSGTSIDAVTANQQSHQSGSLVIASDPSQFYSHILVNRWAEQWIQAKHHYASATSSDRTGFSLGNNIDGDIYLVFDDGTATSTSPYLMRQESTTDLIWSGNGTDQITLGGTAVSSTGGRGVITEAITGGNTMNVATSTDSNSGNLYGLKFNTESGRGRLIFSGYYNATDFTLASIKASSTYIQTTAGINNFYVDNSGNVSASGTLYAYGLTTLQDLTLKAVTSTNIYPLTHKTYDIGDGLTSWRNIFASGTIYGNYSTSTWDGINIGISTAGEAVFSEATTTAFAVTGSGTSTFTGTIQSNSANTSTFTSIWTDRIGNRVGSGTTTIINNLQVNGGIDFTGSLYGKYISSDQDTTARTFSFTPPSNARAAVVMLSCDDDSATPTAWKMESLLKNPANIHWKDFITITGSEVYDFMWSSTSSLLTGIITDGSTPCDGITQVDAYYFQ